MSSSPERRDYRPLRCARIGAKRRSGSACWKRDAPCRRPPGRRRACWPPMTPPIHRSWPNLPTLSIHLYPEYLSTIEAAFGAPCAAAHPGAPYQTSGNDSKFSTTAPRPALPSARRRRKGGSQGWQPRSRSFLWLEEVSLDPRDLCAALPLAAAAAGVVLQEETEVLAVRSQARRSGGDQNRERDGERGRLRELLWRVGGKVQHSEPGAPTRRRRWNPGRDRSSWCVWSRRSILLCSARARGLPGAQRGRPDRDRSHGRAGGIRPPGGAFRRWNGCMPWRRSSGPPLLPPRWSKAGPGCGRAPAMGCR